MNKADKKRLVKEVGVRLKELREALQLKQDRMASHFGTARTNYTKNENGETLPNIHALNVLAGLFDVSLDWLLCGKGPMFYKEKGEQAGDRETQEAFGSQMAMKDVRDLMEDMDCIPLLRYEVLSFYYRFKRDNKELVEETMKE